MKARWYIVFDFGYSDTDSAIIEFDGELDEDEAAAILEMDVCKIRLVEKLED